MSIENVDFLFSENPNPMIVYDPDSLDIVQVNKQAKRRYGYTEDEFLSMTVKELHPKEEQEQVEQVIQGTGHQITESGIWKHRKKNGQSIFVRVVSHPIKISEKNYKLVVATDITKQKRFEERYYLEQDLLSIIIEKLPGTFFVFNKEGEMLRWNKQLENITGFSKEEVREKPIVTYFEEEEQGKIVDAIEEAYKTGSVEVESQIQRKDGSHLPLLFNASSTRYHNEECIVGIGLDISKQVNLLKEKEILISEIHHRVKNNLALINSLLYLQTPEMEEGNVQHLIHDTQVRIKIIALVHELLYKSECFINIDYTRYFEELITLIRQLYDLKEDLVISIDAGPVELNINQALPLSLLINEIFLVIRRGHPGDTGAKNLDISINKRGKLVQLDFEFEGKFDFIEAPNNQQFNDLLISVLCDQLDADFEYSSGTESSCSITFEKNQLKGSSASQITELIV